MTNHESSLKSILEKSHEYLETRIDLVKLKTVDKSSDVLSSLAAIIAILTAVMLCVSMASIGLAYYLGHLLGGLHYGFFIVAGFYAIVVILLYAFRHRWIKTPMYNSIVKKILN